MMKEKLIASEKAQSTLEFALIAAGFISLVLALGALWNAFESGLFVEQAANSASHHLQSGSLGVVGDVFLY